MKKKTFFVGLTACILSLSGAVATAAAKPPKACKLSNARPANRFGSVLVPPSATSPNNAATASVTMPSDVSNGTEGAATDDGKTPAAQLVEPDDEILSPMKSSDKNRKISRRKINRTSKSC